MQNRKLFTKRTLNVLIGNRDIWFSDALNLEEDPR